MNTKLFALLISFGLAAPVLAEESAQPSASPSPTVQAQGSSETKMPVKQKGRRVRAGRPAKSIEKGSAGQVKSETKTELKTETQPSK